MSETVTAALLICLKPIPRKNASSMIRRKISLTPGGPQVTLFQRNRVGEERDPELENFAEIDDRRIARRLLAKEEFEIALVDEEYEPYEAEVQGEEAITDSGGKEVDAGADVVAHAEMEANIRKGERTARRRERKGSPDIEESMAPTRKKKAKRKRKPRKK